MMRSLVVNTVFMLIAGVTLAAGGTNPGEEISGGPINVPSDGIIDGVYIQQHIPTKRMIPYEYVREADAMWSRRVWEYIDLREKINHPLYYPHDEWNAAGYWIKNATRWSLWTVIKTHVMNGDLTIYSPFLPELSGLGGLDGDQLKYPIEPQPGLNFFTDSVFALTLKSTYLGTVIKDPNAQPLVDERPTLPDGSDNPAFGEPLIKVNPDGSQEYVYPPDEEVPFMSQDIIQYKLKEDWFFDKERSVLDVRIIAIAPVVYNKQITAGPSGNTEQINGTRDLFWLYFPHCRFVFNNYFVYNDKNDSQWMSFDDLFWKRKFNGVIYKATNTFDRQIESYRNGIDALYESEKIKDEIRLIEHDVWSF